MRGSRKTALCTTPCAHTLKTRSETLRIRYVLPGYEERIKSFKVKPGPNNPPTTRLFKLPGGQ